MSEPSFNEALRFGQVPAIAAILYGFKPAVVAIVLAAAWRIGSRTLHHAVLWAIAAAAFLALFAASVPFPVVILAAAIVGFVGSRVAPNAFAIAGHAPKGTAVQGAVIDDDTPTPAHARYSRRRLSLVVASFIALWAAA